MIFMDFIINFYKELDTLNIIIFWGIITVIILLLIFSILLINKNKKLKMQIAKEKENITKNSSLPIINQEQNKEIISNTKELTPPTKQITSPKEPMVQTKIKEEEHFVAEEHVMEYNKELFSLSNIKKVDKEILNSKTSNTPSNKTENNDIYQLKKTPNIPYQKNVLKEMSLGQTSPIGIIKPQHKKELEEVKAKELASSLNEEASIKDNQEPKSHPSHIANTTIESSNPKEIPNFSNNPNIRNNIETPPFKETLPPKNVDNNQEKTNYNNNSFSNNKQTFSEEGITQKEQNTNIRHNPPTLKEKTSIENRNEYFNHLSKKLQENSMPENNIDRTTYELQQEEDAIISYEELMQKKDSIQIVDEEDAVISIEELIARKHQEEKLYHLTEEEGNETFIDELKQFRSDL